jgi:cytochrome c553
MTARQTGGTARLQATARQLGWLSLLLACQSALNAYGAPSDTPAPDNIETRVLACTPCHGLRGQGTQDDYFPRLAGKPAGYLDKQLVAFRDGRRHYAPMNYLLEYQNDAYLQAIADYFASQDPPYLPRHGGTTDSAVLARGRSLATQGNAARGIPACAGCHNPNFTGLEPGIPALVGLQANYISAQLGAWRYGTRTATSPDCMQLVAARLSEDDVSALAAWLSSLPAPTKPTPLPQGSLVTPLLCGSEPQISQTPAQATSQATPQPQPATSTLIGKGLYLARAGDCIACHTIPDGKLFAGNRSLPTPFGTLYSSNITPDEKDGIGKWSDADFYATMHVGRMPDGGLLYPAMPFGDYTRVTRADSDAIFAYLRSVPAVSDPNRPQDPHFPFNNRSLILGWRTLFFTEGTYQTDSAMSGEWNRGAYLVEGLGHCGMCHTPINQLGGSSESKAFQGGLIPLQKWYAPSLTSNKETGLGDWSLQDISDYLHKGVSARGAVYGPMSEVVYNSLQYLTDADIRAVSVYLKSLAQRSNPGPEVAGVSVVESSLLMRLGKTVYSQECASCHGVKGSGDPPRYPPLANNQSIQMESAVNPIRMVLNGGFPPGTAANPLPYGMPPFAQRLSNDDVAAVVTYIRSSWGNHGTAISPRQVDDLRSAPLD